MMKTSNEITVTSKVTASQKLFAEGLVVSLIMAGAYIFTFSYQAGYARVFNVPLELIDITLTQLLITATAIMAAWFMVVLSASQYWNIRRYSESGIEYVLHLLFLMLVIGYFVIGYLFKNDKYAWMTLLGLITLLVLWLFIPPLIFQRDKASYREKFDAQMQRRIENDKGSLSNDIEQRFGRHAVKLFWLFIAFNGVAELAGEYHARHEEKFYVLTGKKELVILRMYGSNIISAPFNRKTKQVQPELKIYTLSQNAPISMHKENIGPLLLSTEIK